jgi:hypothetical protein
VTGLEHHRDSGDLWCDLFEQFDFLRPPEWSHQLTENTLEFEIRLTKIFIVCQMISK